ncbi:dnaJ homolog subfamily C member 4-like isoform X3 [Montipora capricornis]|uniref:dnaJ homolog subfamily C member 4-like isoform X3 n=1 Tax=Montipora capricornis TaxID=246305 RepID=UPI0035F1C569
MFMCQKTSEWQAFGVFHLKCPYLVSRRGSTSRKQTFYEVLDVPQTATPGEIRSAFIEKSKQECLFNTLQSHPDMNPHKPELHDAFVQINEAYNVLSNAGTRKEYDLMLGKASNLSSSRGNPFGSVPNHRKQSYSYYYEKATSRSNYRQSRPYGFSPQVVNAAQKQKHNRIVMIGILVFMVVGSSLSYLIVRSRHKVYKTQAEESSRRAHQLYVEAKERGRANGFKRQLELLISQHNGLDKVTASKILREFDEKRK